MLNRKKDKEPESKDIAEWLAKISSQLERLIVCQEVKLSGQVYTNFSSEKHLEQKKEV